MAFADGGVMGAFSEALVESLSLNVELIEMITSLASPEVRERESFQKVLARVEQLKELRSWLLGEMESVLLQ